MKTAKKKLTNAELKKLSAAAVKLGLPTEAFMTSREYSAKCKRQAKALPRETRQAVLDAWRTGGMNLGEETL